MFEHIDMLSIAIGITQLGSDLGDLLGHLWSENDGITSWLRLKAISNSDLHLH